MDLLQMILIVLVVVIVAAVGYYIYTIMSFRKLILFESELKTPKFWSHGQKFIEL